MAFFDEGDEPRSARSRRTRGANAVGGGRPVDPQTLRVRRLVAAGIALLVLILLILGISSCVSSAQRNALRDYNREVAGLGSESRDVVADAYRLLDQDDLNPIDQQTQMNQLRVRAQTLAERARAVDAPDDMRAAHQNLVLALDLRADGIGQIAQDLPAARGDEEAPAEEATRRITAQSQAFLASDVVWTQRVEAFLRQEFAEAEVEGARVPRSQVFRDLAWLNPEVVADRIGGRATGSAGEEPAPGAHGHGLTSVTVGDTRLSPDAAAEVPLAPDLTFTVAFQNQGTNEEQDVRVQLVVRPSEGAPITVTRVVDQTAPNQTVTVPVRLERAPPAGVNTTVEVAVERVAGERTVDNNEQTYSVIFTQP
ncbi:MAG: hypothetical protein M3P39_10620 [Actinomycetota bacterium]|nr:hypothetical protein [Actinomycetota bacterium]